jgi:hypothetical protein
MKTLKLLWDIVGALATIVLWTFWLYKGLTADNSETSTLYFTGMFAVLIHHEVTKEKK